MFADANAFDFEIAILLSYGNQAEISGASADVADQDDISATDLGPPATTGLRRPRVKGRLGFFEKNDFTEAGCFGGGGS